MISAQKDLRSGEPVWNTYPAPPVLHHRLSRDRDVDVLIIGTGISGAMVGEAVAAAGFDVAIVDRRLPAHGSTAASTALVQYELDTPLIEMSRKIGHAKAVRAWRRSRLAVTGLAARLRELDVAFALRDGLYLAGTRLSAKELRAETAGRARAGLETLYLGGRALKERFGIVRDGALLAYENIAVNPRAMTAAFLRQALRLGASIYSPVTVVDIQSRRGLITARTDCGRRIRARTLIVAGGYELPKCVPSRSHKITSTWAFATKPQARRLWPEQCFIWEASWPYLYLRATADGRIICGGEDEDFHDEQSRDALIDDKVATLSCKLRKLLPFVDVRPEFSWTASFGESRTGLPSIGLIPGMRNCWAVLGYGGNGITYSRIAAEVIRTSLLGHVDPDADLYRFRR